MADHLSDLEEKTQEYAADWFREVDTSQDVKKLNELRNHVVTKIEDEYKNWDDSMWDAFKAFYFQLHKDVGEQFQEEKPEETEEEEEEEQAPRTKRTSTGKKRRVKRGKKRKRKDSKRKKSRKKRKRKRKREALEEKTKKMIDRLIEGTRVKLNIQDDWKDAYVSAVYGDGMFLVDIDDEDYSDQEELDLYDIEFEIIDGADSSVSSEEEDMDTDDFVIDEEENSEEEDDTEEEFFGSSEHSSVEEESEKEERRKHKRKHRRKTSKKRRKTSKKRRKKRRKKKKKKKKKLEKDVEMKSTRRGRRVKQVNYNEQALRKAYEETSSEEESEPKAAESDSLSSEE